MIDISFQRLIELSVVAPDDPPELKSIYQASIERFDLTAVDYLTIRDLLAISCIHHIHVHLLLIILFVSLSGGSVCLDMSPESLLSIIKIFDLGQNDTHIAAILSATDDLIPLIHRVTTSPSLEDPFETYKPLVLVDSTEGRFLYFQKYYAEEHSLLQSLTSFVRRDPSPLVEWEKLSSVVDSVLHQKPPVIQGTPALLNDEQKAAVLLPALGSLSLISGGPGTGKTFIALAILRIMTRLGIPPERICIAAPTGRAAQRLTDAIHRGLASIPGRDPHDEALAALHGTTLHRLLRYSPSRNQFLHNRHNRIEADLVILDEASMIDITLLAGLFESLDDGTRLVMMGDRNQLPSVEAGAVLADLIPHGRNHGFSAPILSNMKMLSPGIDLTPLSQSSGDTFPTAVGHPLDDRVVILNRSYRSGKDIQEIAAALQSADLDTLAGIRELDLHRGLPESGVWRIEPGKFDPHPVREIRTLLGLWSDRHYTPHVPSGKAFESLIARVTNPGHIVVDSDLSGNFDECISTLDRARILTPLRSGLTGAAGINALLSEKIGPIFDSSGTDRLFSGMPIMITRNDYTRELFNGDIGLVIKGPEGIYYAAFSRIDGPSFHPVESLPPYEPAYAITVHKSQGSEYDQLLLMLSESVPEIMLTAELVYTAITRAKNLVILYTNQSVLIRAAQNRTRRFSRIRIN